MPKSMIVRPASLTTLFVGFKSRWIKGGENCSCNSITPSQRSGNHCAARATDPSRSYTSSRSARPWMYSMTTTSSLPVV